MNKDFLKAVLTDDKRLMKKKAVDFIHVPGWDELAVKKLWPDLKEDAEFKVYFQDEYANEKGPCREYFFNILNTVYPEYLGNIMSHAAKERFALDGAAGKTEAIKATEEWY